MPETEIIELRTDTVEQITQLLNNPYRGNKVIPRERRDAIIDRIREQTSKPDAIALCGLPGAGKSEAAKKLAAAYETRAISMGAAIRHEYKERNWLGQVESSVPNEIPSDKLAQFAADWREQDPEAIPEKVVEMVEDGGDDELVIIEGVRSRTDYDVLSEYFDDFYLLQVKAPFYTRIGRLQERGREGEEKFTAVDLAERDENELYNLGFDALRESDAIDIDFRNDSSLKNLTINLSDICENNLPFEIQDGTEFGLDDEMEQFRKREI